MVSGLQEFLTRAERFFSPRTGLVMKFHELCVEPGDPLVHVAATEVAHTSHYGLPHDCSDHNGGAGLTREEARAAALGESIERYALSVYQPDDLTLASYRDLPGRAVHPDVLTPFSAKQYARQDFPYLPFTEGSRVRWVEGTALDDGSPIWYPASLTYVPYSCVGEEAIAPVISTGSALGLTPADAILAGLCEVVERDAIMIMWWNRLHAPEIKVPEDSWLGRIIARHFTVPNVTFRLFDITTDTGIPAVFCVAGEAYDNGCAIACGAAARPDPAQAALKALIEAGQGRGYVRYLSRQFGPTVQGRGFKTIRSFEDHVRLYGDPQMKDAFAFLTRRGRTVKLTDLPSLDTGDLRQNVRGLVTALKNLDLEPLAIDLTTADLAQVDLCAAKVAVPGMVELNPSHALRCHGYRRLYEAPVRMGVRREPLTEAELNPFPHPFP